MANDSINLTGDDLLQGFQAAFSNPKGAVFGQSFLLIDLGSEYGDGTWDYQDWVDPAIAGKNEVVFTRESDGAKFTIKTTSTGYVDGVGSDSGAASIKIAGKDALKLSWSANSKNNVANNMSASFMTDDFSSSEVNQLSIKFSTSGQILDYNRKFNFLSNDYKVALDYKYNETKQI
jgi:hypothetical protein